MVAATADLDLGWVLDLVFYFSASFIGEEKKKKKAERGRKRKHANEMNDWPMRMVDFCFSSSTFF